MILKLERGKEKVETFQKKKNEERERGVNQERSETTETTEKHREFSQFWISETEALPLERK